MHSRGGFFVPGKVGTRAKFLLASVQHAAKLRIRPEMHQFTRRSLSRFPALVGTVCTLPLVAFGQKSKSPTPSPRPSASSAVSPTPTPLPQYALPDPVATVNGQPIQKAELEKVTEALLNASGRSLRSLSLNDQKAAFRQMLANLIIDRIVTAKAADEKVDPMEIETRLEDLRRQYAAPDGFEADVRKSGQTLEQVRQNIRNQIAREHWIDKQIAAEVTVTPQEVEKFYQDGPANKFDEPEKVTASHILIKVRRDAPPEDVIAAEKRAKEAAEHLKGGELFESVALQYSDDPTVKKNKGSLGSFSREGVMPEFANVAFSLKVGEVSAPVRTQFGFHLIKVTEHKPAHTDSLEEARPRITAYISEQKRRRATAELVQKLRDEAKIEIAPDLRDEPAASPTP